MLCSCIFDFAGGTTVMVPGFESSMGGFCSRPCSDDPADGSKLSVDPAFDSSRFASEVLRARRALANLCMRRVDALDLECRESQMRNRTPSVTATTIAENKASRTLCNMTTQLHEIRRWWNCCRDKPTHPFILPMQLVGRHPDRNAGTNDTE